ncbi:alkanesulfonate monooxygenase [Sphingobium jiangsuense]|uniref:Alkanesulfonate monooxygenase SsuD/methylene tetrahydromethanopterin reductase-like flavin-dependent oxidoreductase (Luciferase family) n=1 Tax=Sphingobium jiangsuense TaxID=870476 RepID=A0A7W6BJK2_9SPHN|nr:LLM class flavin-dependent oxidoreductase [Sphingobium jiangsuense]MBB3928231.1 alkanesulfonate monooxygenase SsuD/methylene tetrahydromethanopterin reductase-like flavin-dependent oxidoreductase (luciferase family) [Sphingobium jiangsuense]GLS99393.1 alkanesulfonate monooxygenase [Sphingobium jiangsuense]
MKSWKDDPRAATNPLFNGNRLKLGLFGLNAGHLIMSLAPDRYIADWNRCDAAVGMADALGLEVAVSLMGWEPRPELEPFTWATALAARHAHPAMVATMHVQLNHPVFVAKAAATGDRVSGGRFALNLVAGANPATFGAFGVALEDHETRYAHAREWLDLLRRLWTAEEPFDFEGRFYKADGVLSLPKPIQHFPAIMNAGTSARGREFACEHADIVFTHISADLAEARTQIADYKRYARETFDREVQIWTHGYTVIRETQREAEDFLNYYAVEHADRARVEHFVTTLGATAQSMSAEERWKFDRNWAAGGGFGVVGSMERVAELLVALSDAGLDGILLNTIEPETMLDHLGRGVLPRLEAAGVRAPHCPGDRACSAQVLEEMDFTLQMNKRFENSRRRGQ